MAEQRTPSRETPAQPCEDNAGRLIRLWEEAGEDPIKFAKKLEDTLRPLEGHAQGGATYGRVG